MIDLAQLLIRLKTEGAAAVRADIAAVKDEGKAAQAATDGLGGSLGRLGGISITPLATGLTLAATGALAAAAAIKNAVDEADRLGDLASAANMTAEQFSRYAYAAKLSGIENAEFSSIMQRFNISMAQAASGTGKQAEWMRVLGISVRDANGNLKSNEELLGQVSDRLNRYGDGITKAQAQQDFFGRSGQKLNDFLKLGTDGFRSMADEADRLGATLSGKLAQQANDFNDNLYRLSVNSSAWGRALALEVIPSLNIWIERLLAAREVFGGFTQALIEVSRINFTKGFDSYADSIAKAKTEIYKLMDERDRFAGLGKAGDAEAARFQGQIDQIERRIRFLKETQAALALSDKGEYGDQVSRRFMGDNKPQLPGLAGGGARGDKDDAEKARREWFARVKAAYEDQMNWLRTGDELAAAELKQLTDYETRLARIVDSTRTPIERLQEQLDQIAEAMSYGVGNADELGQAYGRLRDRIDELQNKAADKLDPAAKQLGMTFSSAFENAIVSGKKLRDVINGLGEDILRIFLRKQFTEPAGNFLSGMFSSMGGGGGNMFSTLLNAGMSLFGGGSTGWVSGADLPMGPMPGRAGGGDVEAGRLYRVNELGTEYFRPGVSGTVIPMGKANGGGAVYAPTFINKVDSRADRTQVIRDIERANRASEARILDSMRRNGVFARA